jgi:hypothetical protein
MAKRAVKKYFDASGGSTSEQGPTRDIEYNVFECTEFQDAYNILLRDSQVTEDGLKRNSINGLRRIAATTWEGSVGYSPEVGGLPDPSLQDFPARVSLFSFETGGGTQTIAKNIATVATYAKTGRAIPDVKQMVNSDSDGVKGVDVECAVFNFTVTKAYTSFELALGYVQLIYTLTNCINATPVVVNANGVVMTFAAGDLRFRGASGGQSEDGVWRITFNFSGSKGATVALPDFAPFYKRGWDYLEVKTEGAESGTPAVFVQAPVAAIVHQVYEIGELNLLAL